MNVLDILLMKYTAAVPVFYQLNTNVLQAGNVNIRS